MVYPSPYRSMNNGLGAVSPVASGDFTTPNGEFAPQNYMDSLLSMARFTPTLNIPGVHAGVSPDFGAMNIPMMGGGTNELTAPVMSSMDTATAGMQGSGGWWDSIGNAFNRSGIAGKVDPLTGKQSTLGWGTPVAGLLNGLMSTYFGMKNYGLAKDTLQNSKDQFAMNYGAQRQILNTEMEDRQRARVAASRNAESVDSYMAKNRIK